MKTIINYFKKRQERRLRTKIALNASYIASDLQAIYGFIKNGAAPEMDKCSLDDYYTIKDLSDK